MKPNPGYCLERVARMDPLYDGMENAVWCHASIEADHRADDWRGRLLARFLKSARWSADFRASISDHPPADESPNVRRATERVAEHEEALRSKIAIDVLDRASRWRSRAWPIERLAPGAFTSTSAAASAIVAHVRGRDDRGQPDIGPRFRVGSNHPQANRVFVPGEPIPPCVDCGADGGNSLGVDGIDYCLNCGTTSLPGDYDWTVFADVLRYRRDLADGRVQGFSLRADGAIVADDAVAAVAA